jgi:DNA-binding PadR family transcriptional regulator
MNIKYALLGLLSRQPCSGYDLKKQIVDSSALYWSGNNNQIYKTLVEMNAEGLVTYQVIIQQDLPAKKIYSITPQGLAELKDWLLALPEIPEIRSDFLIRLAWADLLSTEELKILLENYKNEVRAQLLMEKEKARRSSQKISSKPREAFNLSMIDRHIITFLENELDWIENLREGINDELPHHRK